jgi:uncharacterized protein YbjT (DUF2867 family)
MRLARARPTSVMRAAARHADKDAQEWIIRRSRRDWTIVRPTVLSTGPRTGTYRMLVDATDWRSGFISRTDVADLLVNQIYVSVAKAVRETFRRK